MALKVAWLGWMQTAFVAAAAAAAAAAGPPSAPSEAITARLLRQFLAAHDEPGSEASSVEWSRP